MQHRIGLAIWCLRISAVLYFGLGCLVLFLFLSLDRIAHGLVLFVFCLALAVGIEIVNSGLRRRKFWAWVAGLCVFAVYVPSLFIPLGVLGLWGLLDAGSRAEFGIGSRQGKREPDA